MYFITGGRQTQSGLYRVRYVGKDDSPKPRQSLSAEQGTAAQSTAARELRHQLEALQVQPGATALEFAWPHLASTDLWIRGAARLAVEANDVASWQDRALAERQTTAALTALLALARCGPSELRGRLLDRLGGWDWQSLDEEQRLTWLRIHELALIRWGEPTPNEAKELVDRLRAIYPAPSTPLNRELSQLLVYVGAADAVAVTVESAAQATEQSDQVFFLEVLRNARDRLDGQALAVVLRDSRPHRGADGRQPVSAVHEFDRNIGAGSVDSGRACPGCANSQAQRAAAGRATTAAAVRSGLDDGRFGKRFG